MYCLLVLGAAMRTNPLIEKSRAERQIAVSASNYRINSRIYHFQNRIAPIVARRQKWNLHIFSIFCF